MTNPRRSAQQIRSRSDGSQDVRLATTVGLSVAAAVLALLGMMWRYSGPEAAAPLPGMDHFVGQAAWAVCLGTWMFVAAWLVRRVLMARLQWAIVLSLLIHLLLLLTSRFLYLNVPVAADIAEHESGLSEIEEFTLPDYGGPESPDETPQWMKPDQRLPEIEQQQQHERQQTRPDARVQPPRTRPDRQPKVSKAEAPQRVESDVVPQQVQPELSRQESRQPSHAATPVQPAETQQAQSAEERRLEARADLQRSRSLPQPVAREQPPMPQRESNSTLSTARLERQRNEPRPQASVEQVESSQRQAAAARAAESTAEAANIASTQRPADVQLAERPIEAVSKADAGLPARDRSQETAPSASQRNPAVSQPTDLPRAVVAAPSPAAPASGGAAALARAQPTGSAGLSAAAASAEAVDVTAAAGGVAAAVAEPTATLSAPRGAAPTVPTTAGTQTAAPGRRSPPSVGQAASLLPDIAVAGRQAASLRDDGQPTLAASATARGPAGSGRSVAAVGATAEPVAVTATGNGGTTGSGNASGSGTGPLADAPAGLPVARQATGLPGSTASGNAGGDVAAPRSGLGEIRSPAAGSGLTGRSTEPSAALGSEVTLAPGSRTGFTPRSAAGDIPASELRAEQAGSLVMAGPQSGDSGSEPLAGPAVASLPRRSAGLPGSSGLPGPAGVSGQQTAPVRVTGGLATGRETSDRPALATQEILSGLAKQSTPGGLAAVESPISPGFSMRKPSIRGEVVETLGGSKESEQAVEAGLVWLANHQHPDGRWSIHGFHEQCSDHECSGPGSFQADSAATGFALLAYLGAAYTHQSGKHQETVGRGLQWLVRHQKPNGDLFRDETEFVWFYSHGIAAIALCEAYGMTKDPALRGPAQKAVNFIVESQHPEFGGWRYRPRFETDTSVSGWQLMALKSAEMAGLDVPSGAYAGVSQWLDQVESKSSRGRYAYHPTRPVSLAMTAEGLLMRQYLGAKRDDPGLIAGADYLRDHLPQPAQRDVYYWYYATQVMFHLQGAHWDEWNARLRDLLVGTQVKEGGPAGSWDPDAPTKDRWGAAGGRLYVTCMNLLMLEVYYRHLPLYLELER